jgi:outer membrane protein TolC
MTRQCPRVWLAVAAAALAALGGCGSNGLLGGNSPFADDEEERLLRKTVSDALGRELLNLPAATDERLPTQPPAPVEEELAARRAELDALSPDPPGAGLALIDPAGLGLDLTGATQEVRALNLQTAIGSAVQNNLSVQLARLQPAINETDVIAAEAAFDAVWVSSAGLTKTDQPQAQSVLFGTPLGTPVSVSDTIRFDTALVQPLTSGGALTVSTDLSDFNNKTPGFEFSPDPAYTAGLRLGLEQPLLRGFGSEVNLATIRLARNAERSSIQALRTDLLDQVAETERVYWNLALAWHELAIRHWLVRVGEDVRNVLDRRRQFDTTLAQYSDAVARVEERKANVIRAQRRLRSSSDALKVLVNDPEATIGSELLLAPLDEMFTEPLSYNLRDAMVTAMERRPEIQQAILAIDDASIREMLADNSRLPLLNLAAELAYIGLDEDVGGAYSSIADADFIDYFVGLSLEVPIGNRAAEAGFRRARLERSAAVIRYRQAVQNVVADVKGALRDVVSNYELIQASRSFRVAQAENLRALLAEEQTLASLTPVFLNLKFQTQETLAQARLQEILAIVDYSQAVARLHRAMGIGLEANRINLELVDERERARAPQG